MIAEAQVETIGGCRPVLDGGRARIRPLITGVGPVETFSRAEVRNTSKAAIREAGSQNRLAQRVGVSDEM